MTSLDQFPAELRAVKTKPLFVMNVTVSGIHTPGGPIGAERRISDLSGGTFSGDRLSGAILSCGTDWQTIREDGSVLLDARVTLGTDDGALIAMSYAGIRHGPPDIIRRIERGEDVDPGSYYFRIMPSFATAAPRYEWLNRIAAIGIGHRQAGGPIYSIFEVL